MGRQIDIFGNVEPAPARPGPKAKPQASLFDLGARGARPGGPTAAAPTRAGAPAMQWGLHLASGEQVELEQRIAEREAAQRRAKPASVRKPPSARPAPPSSHRGRVDLYLLPSGARVRVARDVSRMAHQITYQLAGGEVVQAKLLQANAPPSARSAPSSRSGWPTRAGIAPHEPLDAAGEGQHAGRRCTVWRGKATDQWYRRSTPGGPANAFYEGTVRNVVAYQPPASGRPAASPPPSSKRPSSSRRPPPSSGRVLIEYGIAPNKRSPEMWLPFLWINGRKTGDEFAAHGYSASAAIGVAQREAQQATERYAGDWRVTVAARPGACVPPSSAKAQAPIARPITKRAPPQGRLRYEYDDPALADLIHGLHDGAFDGPPPPSSRKPAKPAVGKSAGTYAIFRSGRTTRNVAFASAKRLADAKTIARNDSPHPLRWKLYEAWGHPRTWNSDDYRIELLGSEALVMQEIKDLLAAEGRSMPASRRSGADSIGRSPPGPYNREVHGPSASERRPWDAEGGYYVTDQHLATLFRSTSGEDLRRVAAEGDTQAQLEIDRRARK